MACWWAFQILCNDPPILRWVNDPVEMYDNLLDELAVRAVASREERRIHKLDRMCGDNPLRIKIYTTRSETNPSSSFDVNTMACFIYSFYREENTRFYTLVLQDTIGAKECESPIPNASLVHIVFNHETLDITIRLIAEQRYDYPLTDHEDFILLDPEELIPV